MEITTNYRVASIIKLIGFGVSVIQRLCKTSVKKNLYWTIKDKVIEESFNGVRSIKRSARVKVYGTDSTREVRARLIEILYDRVRYHKDKFVAPILHKEMQAMQVKKNGKVEHSDNSHDDQVFSYLHALYVWYDGENLAEKFHIQKNTIKTDEDEEVMESELQDQLEKKEKIDFTELEYDPESDIQEALKFVKENTGITTSTTLKESTYLKESQMREMLLASNKDARQAYCEETGLDPSMFMNGGGQTFVTLPDQLFTESNLDYDFEDKEDQESNPYSHLDGNLANLWLKI